MYQIVWQIEKIKNKQLKSNIFAAVDELRNFPDCRNIKALKSHKYDFRLRVGRYRVFFNVSTARL